MPRRRILKLAVPAFAAALLAALPSSAANVEVTATPSLTFSPATVTINVGDTVTWRNGGGIHNVHADDNSFRCANGCADAGGNGDPDSNAWMAARAFNVPGTFRYYCDLHGSTGGIGMSGTVIVQGSGGGGENHGALRFSMASYSVNEGTGSATISVQRIDGDDGAVAVTYSAAAGTATAGQDFTSVTGTLSWADNDDAPKTFAVSILNDSADEPNETVNLSLANPTGGATLNAPSTATLTILDNDPPGGGGSVAAPGNLQVEALSATEVRLTWSDNSGNETGFRVERRTVLGTFQEVGTVGPGVTTFTASGLQPSTFYLFRVRAAGSGDTFSGYSNEAGTATLGDVAPCVAGPQTLCVNNGRFMIEVDWRIPDGGTGAGQAVPVPSAPDSGLFFFFGASNIEMLIKVLNACGLNNRYWVFFAATTNVEFAVVVTDTQTGRTKAYHNPLNRPAPPVQDVEAFATCP